MTETKEIDVDSLLDETLDDLADMPEFKVFPAGAHKVLLSLALKEVSKENVVECSLKMVEHIELADPSLPEEEQSKKDDTSNSLFFLSNEIGQGKLKKLGKAIATALGIEGASTREVIEAAKDLECLVVTAVTIDKKDKTRSYLDIVDVIFE